MKSTFTRPAHRELAIRIVPIVLFLGLFATGCDTLQLGVERTPQAGQAEVASTVAALSAENARLATRVAILETAASATPDLQSVTTLPLVVSVPPSSTLQAAAEPASPTAVPGPTRTAKPTSTPAPTTTPRPPAPTHTPGPCLPASAREKALLAAAPQLGCPVTASSTLWMGREPFQHGQMVWRSDESAIYVLYNDGTFQRFDDNWLEGQLAADPALQAPQGALQPVRGFGRVWRERLGGPNARLGWATESERGLDGDVQEWKGGLVFRFGQETLLLLNKGTWQQAPQ